MKHCFLIFAAAALLLSPCAQAQGLSINVKGGFTMVDVQPSDPMPGSSFTFRPGYSFGVSINKQLNETFGIRFEPGYIEKGSKYEALGMTGSFKLAYINLPLLVSYKPFNRFYIEAGPELAYLLKASTRSGGTTYNVDNIYDKKVAVSGIIGCSADLHPRLNIGARYGYELTHISETTYTDQYGQALGESKEHTQYFELFLRVRVL